MSSRSERRLSPQIATIIEPALAAASAEVIAAIAASVPEYARPLEGRFGDNLRLGIGEALREFVNSIRDPEAVRENTVYYELGAGEMRHGRTLDALQSAYRVGARIAWVQVAEAAREAAVSAEDQALLAEAIFAFIDELAAASVAGYSQARSELERQRERRRGALLSILIATDPSQAALVRAAAEADWPLPKSVAAVATEPGEAELIAARIGPECLGGAVEGTGAVVVADPDGPGRRAVVDRALAGRSVAIGPTVAPTRCGFSWRLATTAARLPRSPTASAATAATTTVAATTTTATTANNSSAAAVRADEHLVELLIATNLELLALAAERAIAPISGERKSNRERLIATVLAYVHHGGNAAAVARALSIHPQTARTRIRRLHELYGGDLDDPDRRLEIELGLRYTVLAESLTSSSSDGIGREK